MFDEKAPSQTMRKSRTASAARAVPGVKGTSPWLSPSPVSSTSGAGGRRSRVSRTATLPRSQQREDALTHLPGLLQVGLSRQDDVVEAGLVVLGDALGHLVVAAHQRRARAAAHEPEAGPQVRRDDEVLATATVQGEHAPLPDRLLPGQPLLG